MSEPARLCAETLHATAIVLGEDGILIRGRSGSGKSCLAQQLIDRAAREGRFGRLVSDDRVRVSREDGRLVARAIPETAGMIELRGIGIVRVPFEPVTVIRLVVDCGDAVPRMPERADATASICEVELPRIAVNGPLAPDMVSWRLRCLNDTWMTVL